MEGVLHLPLFLPERKNLTRDGPGEVACSFSEQEGHERVSFGPDILLAWRKSGGDSTFMCDSRGDSVDDFTFDQSIQPPFPRGGHG